MNSSLKHLVLPVVMLMPLLSTEAVGDSCIPTGAGAQTPEMALTVCPSNPKLVLGESDWPANYKFRKKLDFQIRSCGDYSCNRAARFTAFTYFSEWDNDKLNLVSKSGKSKIPLSATVIQTHSPSVELQLPQEVATECYGSVKACKFRGSGLTYYISNPSLAPDLFNNPDDCPECVDFELVVEADLKQLINQGILTEPGRHEVTFNMGIQQHWTSVNTESLQDAGHSADVPVTISLVVPDLIQISGLNDMTLTHNNLEASQEFCVWRLGGQKFSIKANGKYQNGSYLRLGFGDNCFIPYGMRIGRIGGKEPIEVWGNNLENKGIDWYGDCESFGDNVSSDTNMSLEIYIRDKGLDGKPAGVYKDTMMLTVEPG